MKKRNFSVQLSNGVAYTLMIVLILLITSVGVYAYGTSNPSVVGHSVGEIEGLLGFATGGINGCGAGKAIQAVDNNGGVTCEDIPDVSGFAVASTLKGFATGGIKTCAAGSSIRVIADNGDVTCETEDSGLTPTTPDFQAVTTQGASTSSDVRVGTLRTDRGVLNLHNGAWGGDYSALGAWNTIRIHSTSSAGYNGDSANDYGILLNPRTGDAEFRGIVASGSMSMITIDGTHTTLDFNNNDEIYFDDGGGNKGTFKFRADYQNSGDIANSWVEAGHFVYSSDLNLKKNIQPLSNSLWKIQQLNGVTFDWKDSGKPSLGVIAQDVEKVFPLAVDTNEETGLKSVDYPKLVAPLIEAVKEQQKQIESLKKEVEELKNK